ncbi:MAG: DMT family transporter [Ruminococcaceae bacterium]|nr:DMT family transporter [Oscillospiraceae bacterium]
MKVSEKAKIELASAFLIWGTVGIFVKFIPLNSGIVAFDRSVVGMLFLIAVKLCMKSKINFSALKSSLPILCINGALLGLNWILLFESYNYTSVATSTICYNLGPMLVVMVSPLVFKERLTLVKIVCAVTSLFGVVCVSGVFEENSIGDRGLMGVLLGLSAAVVYAVTVIINKQVDKINPMDKAITQFSASTVVMFIYCLFVTKPSELQFTAQTIILLIIVGVIHTGVAYIIYFKSLPNVTSQNVALFAYIDPVVAVVLSALILKESMSFYTVLGAVLVVVSAIFSELYDNKQKKGS